MSAPRPFRLERRRFERRTESRIVRVADGEPVTAWAAERPGLIVAIDVGRALVRWALVRGIEHVLARR